MKLVLCLRPVLFVIIFLWIISGNALGFQRPNPKLIKNKTMLVHVEEQKLVIKIQTRSNPRWYVSYTGVNIGIDIGMGSIFSSVQEINTWSVSKQYVQDGMFVIELSLPLITADLPRFNWISVILSKGSRREEYLYKSDELIYEELERPYFPQRATYAYPQPIVHVEKGTIIIKIQTHSEPECYDSGVYGIRITDMFSKQYIYLTDTDVSKQYIQDGMVVIEIDKLIVTRELTAFTSMSVTLINSGKREVYGYVPLGVISLTEESKN